MIVEDIIKKIVLSSNYKYRVRRNSIRESWIKRGFTPYFAHELCMCNEKLRLSELYHTLDEATSYNPAVIVGEIIQSGLKEYISGCEIEPVIEKQIGSDVVIGSPDFYSKENGGIVIDVKFKRRKVEPLEHHRLRVAIYKWLADAQNGLLIYISPTGIKEFIVDKTLTSNDIKNLIISPKSPMWPEWECTYCIYSHFCSKCVAEVKKHEKID